MAQLVTMRRTLIRPFPVGFGATSARLLTFLILTLALAPAALVEAGQQSIGIPVTQPEPATLKLAETAHHAGRPVSAVLYPDARHAFDAANLRGRVHVAVARRGKGATIEYNAKAHDDAERQVRRFLQAQLGS